DADHVVAGDFRHSFQEENALDELLRVLHLAERFLVVLFVEVEEAPVLVHLGLAEILVDGSELDGQRTVQGINNLGITLHGLDSSHAEIVVESKIVPGEAVRKEHLKNWRSRLYTSSSARFSARGRRTVNLLPTPSWLDAWTLPPRACTRCLTMLNPRPV